MFLLTLLLFLLALAVSIANANVPDIVEKTLAGMTWDDLVGQMAQIDLAVLLNEDGTALVQDQLDHYIGELGVGSVLNNVAKGEKIWTIADFRAAAVQIQQTAQKYKRPPVIWGLDSVHGANYLYNTITTPQPINLAATFNTTASFVAGKWASVDTRRAGISWLFSPLLGLSWKPHWSRVYETFGEDPMVVGSMAKAMIKGIQNIDEESSLVPSRAAACGKHWVGYSMPHNGHDRAPSWIPIRHLFQYFLLPWKMVVDEVDTIMESYTEIDGVPNVANRYTLNRLLRGKLGFDGMIVTDYHEIFNLNEWHHTASDRTDAMKQTLEEGSVDMSMIAIEPDEYFAATKDLKESKYKARVTESARRVLQLKEKLNMFKEAFDMDGTIEDDGPTADDLREALHMTTESIILAKNDGETLPLNADESLRVLVTGPTSRSQSYQTGGWTYQWQGVEVGKEDAWFTYGSNIFDAVQNISSWDVVYKCGVDILGEECSDEQPGGALEVAADMNVIIVGIGEENYTEKPGDIRDLNLPQGQIELVSDLRKRQPNAKIIVVYFGGRPRLLGDVVENADAVLLGFLPGPFAGDATRDIIVGDANPSAKLPITYPKYEDGGGIPYLHSVSDMCTKDEEGPLPHWQYSPCEVQWPFGHGHSYSSFEYTNLSIDSKTLQFSMGGKDAVSLTVSVNVKNTGSMAGAETVLFFSFDEFRSTTPEYKRLRGFKKVYLEPGQSMDVKLSISIDDLRFVGPHDNSHYILQDGMKFKITVGAHTDCRADADSAVNCESVTIQTDSEYTAACEIACDLWKQSGCDAKLGLSPEVCWHDCTKIHQSDSLALNNDGWGWNYVECIESILFEPSFETDSCWKLTSFCRDIFSTPNMDEFGNGPTPAHHASAIPPDRIAFTFAFLSGVIGAIMIVTSMRGGVCSRRRGPSYEGVEMQQEPVSGFQCTTSINQHRHQQELSRQYAVPEKSVDAAKYEVLLDWVKSNGGEVNDKIIIQKSSQGCGYGAFTNGEVKEDEILFEVPRKACFTLEAATSDEKFGKAFSNLIEKAGPGGNTVVMAGFMAKEYLLAKEGTTGNSVWSAYFDTLPWERGINNQEHVLFWPEEKIEELLKGSMCYAEAKSLRDEVGLATNIMNKVLGPSIWVAQSEDVDEGGFNINRMLPWKAKPPAPEEPPKGFPEAMKGAFVCLLTRAFQDDIDDDDEEGGSDEEKLVPLLDMLQHSDTPNVRHAMRRADGTVEVRARCDIPSGTELFNQYRSEEEESMPYSRFFTRFGFVPGITEDMENLLRDKSSIFYPQKAEI